MLVEDKEECSQSNFAKCPADQDKYGIGLSLSGVHFIDEDEGEVVERADGEVGKYIPVKWVS